MIYALEGMKSYHLFIDLTPSPIRKEKDFQMHCCHRFDLARSRECPWCIYTVLIGCLFWIMFVMPLFRHPVWELKASQWVYWILLQKMDSSKSGVAGCSVETCPIEPFSLAS